MNGEPGAPKNGPDPLLREKLQGLSKLNVALPNSQPALPESDKAQRRPPSDDPPKADDVGSDSANPSLVGSHSSSTYLDGAHGISQDLAVVAVVGVGAIS